MQSGGRKDMIASGVQVLKLSITVLAVSRRTDRDMALGVSEGNISLVANP